MTWQIRWGKLRTFLETRRENGLDAPALDAEPEETQEMGEFIQAFHILSKGRQLGMAVGPIPLTEIEAYIRLFGEPAFGREVFIAIISQMDAVFLTEMNSKSDNANTSGSSRSISRHKGRGK